MATKVPVYRQISNAGLVVVFGMLILVLATGWYLGELPGVLIAASLFLFYIIISRRLIVGGHNNGLKLVKQGEFQKAIEAYQDSLDFFARYPWLDRFRFLTLMSSSAMCYREMALVSQAYCYVQLNDTKKARELYQQCLDEFPENILASSALRFMDAVKNETEPG